MFGWFRKKDPALPPGGIPAAEIAIDEDFAQDMVDGNYRNNTTEASRNVHRARERWSSRRQAIGLSGEAGTFERRYPFIDPLIQNRIEAHDRKQRG